MDEENLYKTPDSSLEDYNSNAGQIWQADKSLIVEEGIVFPDSCFLCNQKAHGLRLKQKLYWRNPRVNLLWLASPLAYFIGGITGISLFIFVTLLISLIAQKKFELYPGICNKHLKIHYTLLVLVWLCVFLSIGSSFFTVKFDLFNVVYSMVFFLLALVFVVASNIYSKVAIKRYKNNRLWLRGFCKQYLERFPEFNDEE